MQLKGDLLGAHTFDLSAGETDGGLQVVWYDADSLRIRGTRGISLTQCGAGNKDACMQRLSDFVASAVNDPIPALLLVGSAGGPNTQVSPGNSEVGYATSANVLQSLGANAYVFLGLSGPGDYSFVGTKGLAGLGTATDGSSPQLPPTGLKGPNTGAELSADLAGTGTARLTGLLERDQQGRFVPTSNNSPAPGGPSFQNALPGLQQELAEPDVPFDFYVSDATSSPTDLANEAAEIYIAAQLGLSRDPLYGVRYLYWSDFSIDWSAEAEQLADLQDCDSGCPPNYDSTQFAAVKSTLLREFQNVATVQRFFTDTAEGTLQGAILKMKTDEDLSFGAISTYIETTVFDTPPVNSTQGLNPLAIVADVSRIASGAIGPASLIPGGMAVGVIGSATFNAIGGLAALMHDVLNDSHGAPVFDPSYFATQNLELATQLGEAFDQTTLGLDVIYTRLVGDSQRLSDSAAAIKAPASPLGGGGWGLGATDISNLEDQLLNNSQRYIWSSLLAVPETAQAIICAPGSQAPYKYVDVKTTLGDSKSLTVDNDDVASKRLFPLTDKGTSSDQLSKTTLDLLFAKPDTNEFQPPSAQALGFQGPYFLSQFQGGKPGGFPYVQPAGDTYNYIADNKTLCVSVN